MTTKHAILAGLSIMTSAVCAFADPEPATDAPIEDRPAATAIDPAQPATIAEGRSEAVATEAPLRADRPDAVTRPSEEPVRNPGARRHDGFYFRFATGLSVYDQTLVSEDTDRYGGGRVEARTSGVANASAVAIGGTVARGLVIGGAAYTSTLLASDTKVEEGNTLPNDVDPAFGTLSIVGPFFDYYFKADKGLHIEGALGLAVLSGYGSTAVGQDDDEHHDAVGVGLVAGFGHEWWVGDEWSVGILGRVLIAATTAEDDAGVRWTHFASSTPGVLFTGTYH